MTRRDFQLISATLKSAVAPAYVVLAMADALAGTNPRFDRARFLRASGVRPEEATLLYRAYAAKGLIRPAASGAGG